MEKSDLDFGSIKNVGVSVVEDIVREREENGKYKDFIDFCERIAKYPVNKKCIECLIKAGVFDEFGKTRSTLNASYEMMIDAIAISNKNKLENQVSMFDIMDNNKKVETYKYMEMPEFEKNMFLNYEKEMLGLYLSGHPLDNYKNKLKNLTNINSLKMLEIDENMR